MPASFKDDIYALGAHHIRPSVDHETLPFTLETSGSFRLPVPAPTFRVRELEVRASMAIGSHNVFVAETVSDVLRDAGATDHQQLGHVSEFYARYRRQIGDAIAEIPSRRDDDGG